MKETLLSNFKFYTGQYSKYLDQEKRYENWSEAVSRVMSMHRQKYEQKIKQSPKLEEYIIEAEQAYLDKLVLGSQRALQFGGEPIMKHNSKMYNCLTSYADRPEFFNEAMYWLLSGCGVGFRVLPKDVNNLPFIRERSTNVESYTIKDSIEGWADAIKVLLDSYFDSGVQVKFDYSEIRPEGSYIAGGFKAPGPEGLKSSIEHIETLIESRLREGNTQLRTIDVYDIVMHMSDAVLSGGVRRSATICLFHPDDELMLKAKTGNWLSTNPQRARSNNSVMLLKDQTTHKQFFDIIKHVKDWGEPGFVWTEDYDIIFNPCVEIGMYPKTETGESGWQGCNLTEMNGRLCVDEETFYRACRSSAILGTLQAGYTDFRYVGPESKEIFDREALLGCSITGFNNNPEVLFNPEVQRKGAEIIKQVNKEVAELIRINQAARTTCVKPAGNTSTLLNTGSGIHGEHSPKYIRNVQVNKNEDIPKHIAELNPHMVEESVWSANGTDLVFSFPVVTKTGSVFKKELLGVKQLELVKLTQENWVEAGTNEHLCVKPYIRHNVSNTIQVDNWDTVANYIYDNRKNFAGISLLGISGDKDYAQAPFTAIYEPQQILEEYGDCTIFASGLIVDGLHAFNNDLWAACACALGEGEDLGTVETTKTLFKRDWVRRINKFASNYFDGDLKKTTYLLKDVHNYHRWIKITSNLEDLDWNNLELAPNYANINIMGSVACSGDQCEVVW